MAFYQRRKINSLHIDDTTILNAMRRLHVLSPIEKCLKFLQQHFLKVLIIYMLGSQNMFFLRELSGLGSSGSFREFN